MAKKGKKEETVEEVEAVEQSTLSDRERKHFEDIRELEAKCDKLEGEFETAKAEASVAKKRLEEAILTLRSTIRRGPDAQLQLPLGSEDWKATPIGEAITLSEKEAESLADLGVRTVGEFEELRAGKNPWCPGGLLDVVGVGEVKALTWEDEILDWIGQNVNQDPPTAGADQLDRALSEFVADGEVPDEEPFDVSLSSDGNKVTRAFPSRASDYRRERGHRKPKSKARAK